MPPRRVRPRIAATVRSEDQVFTRSHTKEWEHHDGAFKKDTTSVDAAAAGQYKDWASDGPRRSHPSDTPAPPTTRSQASHETMATRPHVRRRFCP